MGVPKTNNLEILFVILISNYIFLICSVQELQGKWIIPFLHLLNQD